MISPNKSDHQWSHLELPTPLCRLLVRFEGETNSFRRLHRLIDLFEWLIKWHTTLVLSDVLTRSALLTPQLREEISLSLQLPSLGSWMSLFKLLTRRLEGASPINWSALEELSQIDKEAEIVALRNRYAHGATVSDEQAQIEVDRSLPHLNRLLASPLMFRFVLVVMTSRGLERWMGLTPALDPELESKLKATDTQELSHLHMGVWTSHEETPLLSLYPISQIKEIGQDDQLTHSHVDHVASPMAGQAVGQAAGHLSFFYNAIRNTRLEELNYPQCVHLKSRERLRDFLTALPLDKWLSDRASSRVELSLLAQPVFGRSHELDTLTELISDERFSQAIITSPPGYGKSTLLAHLANRLRQSDPRSEIKRSSTLHVITYFIRRGDASVEVSHFLKHLYYQLCGLLKVKAKRHHDDLYHLHQAVRHQMSQLDLPECHHSVLLIIDGIDEALRPNSSSEETLAISNHPLLKYIPMPSEGLQMIFGARPLDEVKRWVNDREIEREIHLSPLGPEAVRGMLYQHLNKYDHRITHELIIQILERSEGCPLFITQYCELLTYRPELLGSPSVIPSSIARLYKQLLEQVVSSQREIYELVFVFAVSPAPLGARLVCTLFEEKRLWVNQWMNRLLSVLAEVESHERRDDSPTASLHVREDRLEDARYQLYHETFREFLIDYDSNEVESARLSISKLVKRWCTEPDLRARPEVTEFVLNVGPSILARQDDLEGLWRLLTQSDLIKRFLQQGRAIDARDALELGVRCFAEHASRSTPEDAPLLFAQLCRLVLNAQSLRAQMTPVLIKRCQDNTHKPLSTSDLIATLELAQGWRGLQVMTLLLTGEALRCERAPGEDLSVQLSRVQRLLEVIKERAEELFNTNYSIPTHCLELSRELLSWWGALWPTLSDRFRELESRFKAHATGTKLDPITHILRSESTEVAQEVARSKDQYKRDRALRWRALRAWSEGDHSEVEESLAQMTYLGSKVELCNAVAALILTQSDESQRLKAYDWLKRGLAQSALDQGPDQAARFYEQLAKRALIQGLQERCEIYVRLALHESARSPYLLRRESMIARSVSLYAGLDKLEEVKRLLSQITQERYLLEALQRVIRSRLKRGVIALLELYLPQLPLLSRLNLILSHFRRLDSPSDSDRQRAFKLISKTCQDPSNDIEGQLLTSLWSMIKRSSMATLTLPQRERFETEQRARINRLKGCGALEVSDDRLFFTQRYVILKELLLSRCAERAIEEVWRDLMRVPDSWRGGVMIEYLLRLERDGESQASARHNEPTVEMTLSLLCSRLPRPLRLDLRAHLERGSMSHQAIIACATELALSGWDEAALEVAKLIKTDSTDGELQRRYALRGALNASLRRGHLLRGSTLLLKTELPSITQDLLPTWRRALSSAPEIAESLLLETTAPTTTYDLCVDIVLALYQDKQRLALKEVLHLCPSLAPLEWHAEGELNPTNT